MINEENYTLKKIIFTVTTDLNYDQRMMRICSSIANAGYEVLLVGRTQRRSLSLSNTVYKQKRLSCWFEKGKLFYAEYNMRLFFYLLFKKADCICAIDLDTIIPCYLISFMKNTRRVYDAHEYFSQLDEVIRRPAIYRVWHWVEKTLMPRFPNGYTVCKGLADEFKKHYGVDYGIIRNVPLLRDTEYIKPEKKLVFYQGAVNKGRGLDKLVIAMKNVNARLMICGDGNFMHELKRVIKDHDLESKVELTGMLIPEDLRKKTQLAYIAINPFESFGLNQYLSLPNKFFDYIHATVPQVTMNYPEYKHVNDKFRIAVLIDDLEPETISTSINKLLQDDELHNELHNNCIKAREELNWQKEEAKLLGFYEKLFHAK